MKKQTDIITEFINTDDRYTVAGKFVKSLGKEGAYDLATTILQYLEDAKYCIWQTYTKKHLKEIFGKKSITNDEFEEYAARLQDNEAITY